MEVFNRYEIKYILNQKQYEMMCSAIEEYMRPDAHSSNDGFYTICNIYYDSAQDLLIRRSIEKPVYKEKLRLRSYGVPKENEGVFAEIKKKYERIVNKRRVVMQIDDAKAFLNEGICKDKNNQVMKEISYMRNLNNLIPRVFIGYDRRAYYALDDPDFRVTFDTNIRTRRTDLCLLKGDYGTKLLPPDTWIMEVKIKNAMPVWFAAILSRLEIHPGSFSKYGTEYIKYLNSKKENNNV